MAEGEYEPMHALYSVAPDMIPQAGSIPASCFSSWNLTPSCLDRKSYQTWRF